MNDIDKKIVMIRKEGRVGIMAHLVAGYPSLEKTVSIAKTMANAGVDFIELQMPFSDPIADGPAIMNACNKSLAKGTRIIDFMRTIESISERVSAPLIIMAYYNNVFKYGVDAFCSDAKYFGASGLIVPDMPIDEERSEHFMNSAKKHGLYTIRVVSPISTHERLKKNAKGAEGFVYCTSRQGITGVRKELSSNIEDYLKSVRKEFKIPLAVGFGISRKEHVRALAGHADVVVIGSAILNIINKHPRNEEKNVGKFIKSISGIKVH